MENPYGYRPCYFSKKMFFETVSKESNLMFLVGKLPNASVALVIVYIVLLFIIKFVAVCYKPVFVFWYYGTHRFALVLFMIRAPTRDDIVCCWISSTTNEVSPVLLIYWMHKTIFSSCPITTYPHKKYRQ